MMKSFAIREQFEFGYEIVFSDGICYKLIRTQTYCGNSAEWRVYVYSGYRMIYRSELESLPFKLLESYKGTWNGCREAREDIKAHHKSMTNKN